MMNARGVRGSACGIALLVLLCATVSEDVRAGDRGNTACRNGKQRHGDVSAVAGETSDGEQDSLVMLRGERHGSSLVLSLKIQQGDKDVQMVQLDVYSEPSHNHLLAVLSNAYPRILFDILRALSMSKPAATVYADMKLAGPRVSVPAPDKRDNGIRIEAVVMDGTLPRREVLADVKLGSPEQPFGFSVRGASREKVGGEPFCGWCGIYNCGCIYCPTPFNTLCCPQCILMCGWQICPQP